MLAAAGRTSANLTRLRMSSAGFGTWTSVANATDLSPGSMKEVKIANDDKNSVLLVRSDQDKWFATSAKCTHYGAPLEKGTLVGDKVVCPWHGACFSCASGDIEDAPALDALHTYQVRVQGDTVQVQTPEGGWPQSHKRAPKVAPDASGVGAGKRVVVVGGGAAGLTAVQTLREAGWGGEVLLLTAEGHLPYDRVKLSKGVGVDVRDVLLRPESWFVEAGVQVRTEAHVSSVDVGSKTLVLQGGDTVTYDALLLATGSEARRLPVQGGDASGIHTLRTPEDAQALSAAVGDDASKDVVIVGSSFIGVEYAASLAASGAAKSITVLGSTPFKRVLGVEVGAFVQQKLEAKGVKFVSGHVSAFTVAGSGGVAGVKLEDGDGSPDIAADVVVLGVGAKPVVPVLEAATATAPATHKDGSLYTDGSFKVLGSQGGVPVAGLWAAGDIARFTHPAAADQSVRVEHWSVAQQQGRLAARDIVQCLGEGHSGAAAAAGSASPAAVFDGVPFFWTALAGVGNIRYTGLAPGGFDRVVFAGGEAPGADSSRFVACYEAGGKAVAVATFGADPTCTDAQAILARGETLSSAQVLARLS